MTAKPQAMSSLFLNALKENPFSFVDVGSMGGIEEEWSNVAQHPQFSYVGFEPDSREYQKLKATPNQRFFPYAVYSQPMEGLQFHVCRDSGKSSILPPNRLLLDHFPNAARYDVISLYPLPAASITSLDRLAVEHQVRPDFLKLDTQGTELKILEGAEVVLKSSVLGAKIEVEFIEMYERQPLFRDVDGFMSRLGFVLADLRRVFWKLKGAPLYSGKGQLIFGDALYLRPISALLEGIGGSEDAWNRCVKAMLIAWQYGVYDWATAINRAFQERFPELRPELNAILNSALLHLATPAPSFKGRHRMARWLEGLSQRLTHSDQGYSDADSGLGNRKLY